MSLCQCPLTLLGAQTSLPKILEKQANPATSWESRSPNTVAHGSRDLSNGCAVSPTIALFWSERSPKREFCQGKRRNSFCYTEKLNGLQVCRVLSILKELLKPDCQLHLMLDLIIPAFAFGGLSPKIAVQWILCTVPAWKSPRPTPYICLYFCSKEQNKTLIVSSSAI